MLMQFDTQHTLTSKRFLISTLALVWLSALIAFTYLFIHSSEPTLGLNSLSETKNSQPKTHFPGGTSSSTGDVLPKITETKSLNSTNGIVTNSTDSPKSQGSNDLPNTPRLVTSNSTTVQTPLSPVDYGSDRRQVDLMKTRVSSCIDSLANERESSVLTSQSGRVISEKCLNDVTTIGTTIKTPEGKYILDTYKSLLEKLLSAFEGQVFSGLPFNPSDPKIIGSYSFYNDRLSTVDSKYEYLTKQ
jgi:hypothetical protein